MDGWMVAAVLTIMNKVYMCIINGIRGKDCCIQIFLQTQDLACIAKTVFIKQMRSKHTNTAFFKIMWIFKRTEKRGEEIREQNNSHSA